jgi:hypothetical protein
MNIPTPRENTEKKTYAAPLLSVHGTARDLTRSLDIKHLQDAKGLLATCLPGNQQCCW